MLASPTEFFPHTSGLMCKLDIVINVIEIKLYLIVCNADNDARYPDICGVLCTCLFVYFFMYQPYICLFTF